jgi:hypothetical protein
MIVALRFAGGRVLLTGAFILGQISPAVRARATCGSRRGPPAGLAESGEGTVEHDDALQTTVRALLNDIKSARPGVSVVINNVPGIAGDAVELVEAARLYDSATGDRSMELSHESPKAVVPAEPSVFIDQLDIAGQTSLDQAPPLCVIGRVPRVKLDVDSPGHRPSSRIDAQGNCFDRLQPARLGAADCCRL